jgi:hypothetical protein
MPIQLGQTTSPSLTLRHLGESAVGMDLDVGRVRSRLHVFERRQ